MSAPDLWPDLVNSAKSNQVASDYIMRSHHHYTLCVQPTLTLATVRATCADLLPGTYYIPTVGLRFPSSPSHVTPTPSKRVLSRRGLSPAGTESGPPSEGGHTRCCVACLGGGRHLFMWAPTQMPRASAALRSPVDVPVIRQYHSASTPYII